jgi:hypothetical protein
MPCIKFHREVVSDIDICFERRGLFVQHYDEADNPSRVLKWSELEREMLGLVNQYIGKRKEWEREMLIAKRLVRMGMRLRKALLAIEPELDQPLDLPDRFDPPSSFIIDDDSDDAGEEWKRDR